MKLDAAQMQRVADLLAEFDAIAGVSGDESRVADALERHLAPYCDRQYRDVLGNSVSVREGTDPARSIMVAAHMDEIGFMVSDVTERGYVTVVPVGMHNPTIIVNQALTIYTDGGPVPAVVGAGKPIHNTLGHEPTNFSFADILLDVGATSPEEVRALGVRIGDFANIQKDSRILNKRFFSGKAVDNRASCVALIIMMEALAQLQPAATVYACGTVQEEIGVKGSEVLVRSLKPTDALCLDVGFGSDQGELDVNATRIYAGQGPAIELIDYAAEGGHDIIVPKAVVRALEAAAQDAGIPVQHQACLNCGTDACVMAYANDGVVTGGLSIPQKYLHTTIGLVAIEDVFHTGVLSAHYIKALTSADSRHASADPRHPGRSRHPGLDPGSLSSTPSSRA